MDKRTDRHTNLRTCQRTNKQTDTQTSEHVNGQTDRQTDRQTHKPQNMSVVSVEREPVSHGRSRGRWQQLPHEPRSLSGGYCTPLDQSNSPTGSCDHWSKLEHLREERMCATLHNMWFVCSCVSVCERCVCVHVVSVCL